MAEVASSPNLKETVSLDKVKKIKFLPSNILGLAPGFQHHSKIYNQKINCLCPHMSLCSGIGQSLHVCVQAHLLRNYLYFIRGEHCFVNDSILALLLWAISLSLLRLGCA